MGTQPSSPFVSVRDQELWKIHGFHGIPEVPVESSRPQTRPAISEAMAAAEGTRNVPESDGSDPLHRCLRGYALVVDGGNPPGVITA